MTTGHSRRRLSLLVIPFVVFSSACGPMGDGKDAPGSADSDTFTASGSIKVLSSCGYGSGYDEGLDDVRRGAQVTVLNSRGKRVALGKLGVGTRGPGVMKSIQCTYDFEIRDVPSGDPVYSLEIGGGARGAFDFRERQAGHLNLGLGY